ncbi:MAG TPA: acyl-CoA dehydrogenase family protein [Acidimicrobiales bacterium]|jgi:alkylation response protein AidB-like acyl-CoA dehydrogenase|nr:acyl-CoA dehydrogenase family protein [Acidimicrobiales bacterium]MDP6282075.1 acyl-CoA dehydrogenase family protein [Acidimicrobiales bacterium]MDP7117866.1 acyl-CoA dehydrogenase family protein [Acidimicrobiales bacterium]MDP7411499.1 acyl-CoA dehydrogenase family protein [Acidimicrobiales bacterium]MEE1522304.1 acyl-CoA dehydrogenase family protein [Acidimicrobiales bacterium]|tara:strand:+ start:464 stop:1672 length:1209 start_codon:yes stop_codon:yes gene_type:complete
MSELTEAEVRALARQLVEDVPPDQVGQFEFRGAQFDRGLAMVQFPEGLGGLGLSSRRLQTAVDSELRSVGVTYNDLLINPIGIGMGGPVVLTYASDEQKQRLLRPMFTGEEIWCQMFSEPGSGSDVAGLSTRAERDGDEWIVNGQKVWTTLAHVSRWGMLVARTNPDQPKHKGLTYFLLDMESPGVEVRPLHQITGEAEFNEVFLSDVRIPHDRVFGDVGGGWGAAVTTLMNERVALGGGVPKKGSGPIQDLVDVWKETRDSLDPVTGAVLRDRVADLWAQAEALRLTNWRAREASRGGNPGPEGSVTKLMSAEMNQHIYETCMDIVGAGGMLYEAGYERKRPDGLRGSDSHVRYAFLRARANTIEGGTSEVMRNILGERVLGLPGDVRVDKELPWSEVPRN